MKKVLGVSLGKNITRIGIINQYGELEQQLEVKNSPQNFLENLKEKTFTWLRKKGYDFFVDVERVSVTVPGSVNHEIGTVINSPDFGWSNYPLKENLKSLLLTNQISILNSTNAQALGEFWVGSGTKANSIIYYDLDEPRTGALILDGKLLLGEHKEGSYFRNLKENNHSNIAEQLLLLIKEELSSKTKNEQLVELFSRNKINGKKMQVDELINFKEKGLLLTLLKPALIKQFHPWLEQLAFLINTLDFKTVILSGQICLFGSEFSCFIEAELKQLVNSYFKDDLNVFVSKNKKSSELIGSAYYAITDWEESF